jgi:Ca2+-binding EF-hand superfamily protein
MIRRISPVLVASLLLGGCATKTPHFDAADRNGNGRVTLAEWEAHIVTILHRENDSNRDGRVTFAEWQMNNPSANRARFMKLDTDGDGAISWAEGLAFVRKEHVYDDVFKRMDTDGSGTLDRREAVAFRDHMAGWGL